MINYEYASVEMCNFNVVKIKINPKEPTIDDIFDFFRLLHHHLNKLDDCVLIIYGTTNFIANKERMIISKCLKKIIYDFSDKVKEIIIVVSSPMSIIMYKSIMEPLNLPLGFVRVVNNLLLAKKELKKLQKYIICLTT